MQITSTPYHPIFDALPTLPILGDLYMVFTAERMAHLLDTKTHKNDFSKEDITIIRNCQRIHDVYIIASLAQSILISIVFFRNYNAILFFTASKAITFVHSFILLTEHRYLLRTLLT